MPHRRRPGIEKSTHVLWHQTELDFHLTGILHFFATFSSKTVQERVVVVCSELEHDCGDSRSRQGFQRYRVEFAGKEKEGGVGF